MKSIVIGIAALALSGCSVIAPKVGPKLAKAVNAYCANVSEPERAILRETVNAAIEPNQACVHCAGDTANHCAIQ